MQLTRKEALDEFLRFVNEFGDDESRILAGDALNRSIESIWQQHHWRDFQSPDPMELTLVANQRSYPMPDYFGREGLGRVRNLTRGRVIDAIDSDQADEWYPTRGTTLEQPGSPRHYLPGGIVGVRRQPLVTGEACEIRSSTADDTTNIRVTIVGADENGDMRREQITPNGTTAVDAGTWSYIDEFGKSYRDGVEPTTAGTSSAGTLTLRTVAGVVLQQLFAVESAREHRIFTFLPKPNAADVIAIPVMRRPPRLRFDSDPFPADWWNAIFEDLLITWRVNTGEIALDSVVPMAARPSVLKLIGTDNANKPRPTIRPFGS